MSVAETQKNLWIFLNETLNFFWHLSSIKNPWLNYGVHMGRGQIFTISGIMQEKRKKIKQA